MTKLFGFFFVILVLGGIGTAVTRLLLWVVGRPSPTLGAPIDYLSGLPCGPDAGTLVNFAVFFHGVTATSAVGLAAIGLIILAQESQQFRKAADSEVGEYFSGEALDGLGYVLGIGFAAVICGAGGIMTSRCTLLETALQSDVISAKSILEFETDRASRAVRKTWDAEGINGLRENVAECYASARSLRTERSAMFCFTFDYLTATRHDRQGRESDRITAARERTSSLLDHDGLHMGDLSATLDAWTHAANRAYGDSPSSAGDQMERDATPAAEVPSQVPQRTYDTCDDLELARFIEMHGEHWRSKMTPEFEERCRDAIGRHLRYNPGSGL